MVPSPASQTANSNRTPNKPNQPAPTDAPKPKIGNQHPAPSVSQPQHLSNHNPSAQTPARSSVNILTSRQRARLISRYVTYWIEHVEQNANGKLQDKRSGKIKMRVTIVQNGRLYSLAMLQSTLPGAVSRQAADLIRAASPYAPFPESLARETDRLVISCTMQFLGGEESSAPSSQEASAEKTSTSSGLQGSLSQALLGGGS